MVISNNYIKLLHYVSNVVRCTSKSTYDDLHLVQNNGSSPESLFISPLLGQQVLYSPTEVQQLPSLGNCPTSTNTVESIQRTDAIFTSDTGTRKINVLAEDLEHQRSGLLRQLQATLGLEVFPVTAGGSILQTLHSPS